MCCPYRLIYFSDCYFFLYSFSPIQLLQGLGLNLPAGAETDQHTGSAIAVYLVLHGANVSFYNHEGKTPLDLCQDTQTAALIQQFARNAPRWVTCEAGSCKQYGLRKERGAKEGDTWWERSFRAPRSLLLPYYLQAQDTKWGNSHLLYVTSLARSSLIPGGASVDKNGDFGAISVTERSCDASVSQTKHHMVG